MLQESGEQDSDDDEHVMATDGNSNGARGGVGNSHISIFQVGDGTGGRRSADPHHSSSESTTSSFASRALTAKRNGKGHREGGANALPSSSSSSRASPKQAGEGDGREQGKARRKGGENKASSSSRTRKIAQKEEENDVQTSLVAFPFQWSEHGGGPNTAPQGNR